MTTHPKEDPINVYFIENRMRDYYLKVEDDDITMDELRENWSRIKEVFDKVSWTISGTRRKCKNWLFNQLGDLYTDNFVIRHVNAGLAYYCPPKKE